MVALQIKSVIDIILQLLTKKNERQYWSSNKKTKRTADDVEEQTIN